MVEMKLEKRYMLNLETNNESITEENLDDAIEGMVRGINGFEMINASFSEVPDTGNSEDRGKALQEDFDIVRNILLKYYNSDHPAYRALANIEVEMIFIQYRLGKLIYKHINESLSKATATGDKVALICPTCGSDVLLLDEDSDTYCCYDRDCNFHIKKKGIK